MKRLALAFITLIVVMQALGQSPALADTKQLPFAATSNISSTNGAATSPANLISLSSTVLRSVVTIVCGNRLGSGWAISATMTEALSSQGFNTYLITNHHVISECTPTGEVTVILPNKSKITGTILAYDENYDLAGILISSRLETLRWQASTPSQGYWIGVMGSPLGFPGVLTTGIVSSVNLENLTGTLTAPINPGNSGGPVFDNTGRVIGIATAKFTNSEGFGIFGGSPLLCSKIISCPPGTNAWFGNTTATSLININPIHLKKVELVPRTGGLNKGALFCGIGPYLTKELISTYGVTGTQWRITDLSENKELDKFFVPIRVPSDGYEEIRELSNGRMLTSPLEDVQIIYYDFKSQITSHNYECSVAVVAQNSVGEYTSVTAEASASITNYKVTTEKAQQAQRILDWNLSSKISVSVRTISLSIRSDSNLPVSFASNTKSICLISGNQLVIAKSGRCIVTASQEGNREYLPALERIFILEILKTKNVSILCLRNGSLKKVTAPKPSCPTGYKEKN